MPQVNEHIARVNVANARVINLYEGWVRARGLPYNRFLVLYVLLESGPQTQKRIGERTHLIKQKVSNLVTALAAEGMVEMRPGETDRREKVAALTETGTRYAHEVVDGLLRMEQSAVERLGEDKIAQLAALSTEFGDVLEQVMAGEG